MKVLVVDDSRAMRMIVTRTLRQAGFGEHVLLEAENGAQALLACAAELPDLVLADWNMPVLNGMELLHRLRAGGNEVPFGFVTSESADSARAAAERAGALFFITKPFTADTFAEVIGAALGPGEAQAS